MTNYDKNKTRFKSFVSKIQGNIVLSWLGWAAAPLKVLSTLYWTFMCGDICRLIKICKMYSCFINILCPTCLLAYQNIYWIKIYVYLVNLLMVKYVYANSKKIVIQQHLQYLLNCLKYQFSPSFSECWSLVVLYDGEYSPGPCISVASSKGGPKCSVLTSSPPPPHPDYLCNYPLGRACHLLVTPTSQGAGVLADG